MTAKELTTPKEAYNFCVNVIGCRSEELEKIIIQDPFCSYMYALNVIKGRWPEAENTIYLGFINDVLDYVSMFTSSRNKHVEDYFLNNFNYESYDPAFLKRYVLFLVDIDLKNCDSQETFDFFVFCSQSSVIKVEYKDEIKNYISNYISSYFIYGIDYSVQQVFFHLNKQGSLIFQLYSHFPFVFENTDLAESFLFYWFYSSSGCSTYQEGWIVKSIQTLLSKDPDRFFFLMKRLADINNLEGQFFSNYFNMSDMSGRSFSFDYDGKISLIRKLLTGILAEEVDDKAQESIFLVNYCDKVKRNVLSDKAEKKLMTNEKVSAFTKIKYFLAVKKDYELKKYFDYLNKNFKFAEMIFAEFVVLNIGILSPDFKFHDIAIDKSKLKPKPYCNALCLVALFSFVFILGSL